MNVVGAKNNTAHDVTKILIDYFCFTVSVEDFLGFKSEDYDFTHLAARIEKKFFLAGMAFTPRRGMYGYNYAAYYDGIIYAYGGMDTLYIQMSGTGCRTWESWHEGLTWEKWIYYLQTRYPSLHISRMDVACDSFGLLDIHLIQMLTRHERFISKWRTYLIQEGTSENAVIWGSSKSDFRLRIYDKTQERRRVVAKPEDVPEDWIRCEFQMRNDSVKTFLREWQRNNSIGLTFMGIMRNQLLYCSRYDGKNRDRATVANWWAKLLGDAEQIKMSYDAGKDYNFEQLQKYLFGQAGSSLRTYLSIVDGDLDLLLDSVAGCKLNDRQQELLNTARPARRERIKQQLDRRIEYVNCKV